MRLTVETGPLAGTVVPLDRDQPTTLGSAADCALRVQEAGVLPHQAVVKALKDQGFGIKALAPGVRLNGAEIEAAPLRDGDIIELGTTRIAFGQVQKRGLPTIAGYRLIEELGRGGMGIVYRAEQTSLHREVALKVLGKELLQDPQFVAKFVAEARAAAKLQHPNVVQVFDVEHDGGTYYYAMELMQGSLEDWLKQHGAMPVERALRVVADAAAGLAYAESLGIVHRDIKPDNLMLDQHGVVKIADLGLARSEQESDEQAIGTPHFMAPEQVLRKPLDHRTDLYALGCTFYRLITGRTPFRGQAVKDILRAQVKDEAEPAHKVEPRVPVEVSAIVQKLLAKDPAQRFQTANDLLEELNLLLQPPAKKGLWIGLAATAVLAAGGAIWWAVNKPKDVETRIEYANNPEAARLAKENEQLQQELRHGRALVALLQARVAGLPDRELAAALDRVAAEHAGTPAAVEAGERAAQLRRAADEREQAARQRAERLAQHREQLQRALQAPLQAHDFAAALQLLAAAPPAALRDDPELPAALQPLREQVLAAARQRLAALLQAVEAGIQAPADGALGAAVDALAEATAKADRWPAELQAEVAAAKARVNAGRDALASSLRAQRDSLWQQYRAGFAAGAPLRAALDQLDFAAAAAALEQFAAPRGDEPAAAQARALAQALQRAQAFAAAFEQAAAQGQLAWPNGDGPALQVARWDRRGGQFALLDPAKRSAKEQLVPAAQLPLEGWFGLTAAVPPPQPGARECFLGCLSLASHAAAARTYLGRLQPADDGSGTGPGAYPLSAVVFDQLLRRLPDSDAEPWARALRAELQAGQRLALGLRALAERRNLAAAGHLDQLLGEHPHSYVVAVLP